MDLATISGMGAIGIIKLYVAMTLIFTLFLFYAAILTGIENLTFVKALVAAAAAIGAQWIISFSIVLLVPFIGGILGFMLSIIGMVYILRMYLSTTWLTAFFTLIIALSFALFVELVTNFAAGKLAGVPPVEFIHKFIFVA
jgi:hypothetical protein